MFGLPRPNDAGKSTLMRIVATLQEPDTGRVWRKLIDVSVERRDDRLPAIRFPGRPAA